MAPLPHRRDGATDWHRVASRLEYLYEGNFLDEDEAEGPASPERLAALREIISSEGGSPSVAIPHIISYLSNNDAVSDPRWGERFNVIRTYLSETYRLMSTGSLGFEDPKLRAALEDARVMANVHRDKEKASKETTTWTEGILRGQTTQERLLTYPKEFPPPDPDRSTFRHRPVDQPPRPEDRNTNLWNTSFGLVTYPGGGMGQSQSNAHPLAELESYVQSQNRFFDAYTKSALSGAPVEDSEWTNQRFGLETHVYEHSIKVGLEYTCSNAPPPHTNAATGPRSANNPDGTKGADFYVRRGWQRAALQQCLNMFTSHENRAINTPWRRAVLPPLEEPLALPREIAYVPRVIEPRVLKEKDPFSWLQLMSQYTQIVDFLADCQRKRYGNRFWANFSASALPVNFRGPRIYRGLSVYEQHWLQIGHDLDKLESRLYDAWSVAPRPLLRAILRDIDAGRQPDSVPLAIRHGEDDSDPDRKRYWRRDIKRRPEVDTEDDEDEEGDESYLMIDEFEMAWLRYLCEPSRTIDMCNPSKFPPNNLAILFDAKLQAYFRTLAESGVPDTSGLAIWHEKEEDVRAVLAEYRPKSVRTVVAYINGCDEKDVKEYGEAQPNPEHPNRSYQFAMDEAEFLCAQLEGAGRCVFTPRRDDQPATVGRPKYTVHPEDRITWRYLDTDQFRDKSESYLEEMLEHYHTSYDTWAAHKPDRPGFSRALQFMLDHAGPDFTPELERIETQPPGEGVGEARQPFIKRYLVPESMCRFGVLDVDSIELNRESPSWSDIASWEATGNHVSRYLAQRKAEEGDTGVRQFYSHEPYIPQTPERTVQFLRNLAYRMGRTMRHVEQIKERLQYLDDASPPSPTPKPPLDLSPELKMPRPEGQASSSSTGANANVAVIAVEKWWHAIPAKDYEAAIADWTTAVEDGSGEVALLPPDISEVLAKADPHGSFRNRLKEQDPFTEIREGIIEDCVRNLPTMYPVRLGGFKDKQDKELQAFERPNLFDWATKDQRRYQAQHTREHFFNMQRWPPCRIVPERLERIRAREDEVLRHDPRQDGQAYGILTHRLPVGRERPLYARPILSHAPLGQDLYSDLGPDDPLPYEEEEQHQRQQPQSGNSRLQEIASGRGNLGGLGDGGNGNEPRDSDINLGGAGGDGGINWNAQSNHSINNTTHDDDDDQVRRFTPIKMAVKPRKQPKPWSRTPGLVPYRRSDTRFAPGPAVFPMGDTPLQKMWVSNELTNALYPKLPLYKERLLGLPKLWHKIAGARPPLIPLVPEVSRSKLPRSNPNKRKMPIEFLNSEGSAKRFRSDVAVGLQPGGSGGQFAAALIEEVEEETAPSATTGPPHPAPVTPQESRPTSTHRVPAPINVQDVSDVYEKVQIKPKPAPAEDNSDDSEDSEDAYYITKAGKKVYYADIKAPLTPDEPEDSPAYRRRRAFYPNREQSSGRKPARDTPTPRTPKPRGPPASKAPSQGTIPQSIARPAYVPKKARTPSFPPIPTYPEVSDRDSYERYRRDLPRGFETLDADAWSPYLVTSGLIALERSMQRQLRRYGVITGAATRDELRRTLDSDPDCACLAPHKDLTENNFTANCLAHLLRVFGDRRGLKLQLGLIHEDVSGTRKDYHFGEGLVDDGGEGGDNKNLAAFVIGGPYNDDPDTLVVWVRLGYDPSPLSTAHYNPYNLEAYNTYKGVAPAHRKRDEEEEEEEQ
ncbi:hypothetical protein F5Y17DRAFT_104245 [Xylariaceae sp. FL0594]|nr:hypothetical protein F5Y17DRAFT_104245 [Xylariaceae sp. FL0594]